MENTPTGKLGKYGLIEYVTRKFETRNKSTLTGIGDDAAIIKNSSRLTLVSTDLLLEGIHFNLTYTPLKHLGYKAVIRGISDIVAMNGIPEQVFIGLGIGSKLTVEKIDEIFEGINLACNKYAVDLAGGDTTSSLTGLTISITATGTADEAEIVKRSGAKPNDLVCVTGDLGAAYIGLQILERERRIFEQSSGIQPDLSGNDYVIGRQLKPEVPVDILKEINRSGIRLTSMIDVTDGLASDLMQICKSSGTGCRIFSKQIPVDLETARRAEDFELDPLIPALNGGDDFEMLFTVPLEDYEKIKQIKGVSVIGHITEAGTGNYLVGPEGSEAELAAQGWAKE